MSDQIVQIQSFRVVFDLERRIHRIDRFKIPLPYGLPLRSVAYTLAALVLVLTAGSLPVIGSVVGAIPGPLRYVIVPVAAGLALTRLRLDGRSAHAACLAWLNFQVRPRDLVAFRARPLRQQVRVRDVLVAVLFYSRKPQ